MRASDRALARRPPGRSPRPHRCHARSGARTRRCARTRGERPPPRARARRCRGPARRRPIPRAHMLLDPATTVRAVGLLTRPRGRGSCRRSHGPDRPYVDEAALAERDLLRPLDGFLLAVGLDEIEAAQGLLRLGEGSVHDLALPGLQTDAAGVAVWTQALSVDHFAGGLQLAREAAVTLDDGLHLGPGRRGCGLVVGADEQHVAHGNLLGVNVMATGDRYRAWRPLTITTPMAHRNRHAPSRSAPRRADSRGRSN